MSLRLALTLSSALIAIFAFAACDKGNVKKQAKRTTPTAIASVSKPEKAVAKKPEQKATTVAAEKKKPKASAAESKVLDKTTDGKLTVTDVRKETEEAIAALRVFTKQKEQEYHKRIDTKLSKFNDRLEELRGKADKIGAEVKSQVSNEIAQLTQNMKATEEQISAINLNSEGKLQELTKDLETMLANLDLESLEKDIAKGLTVKQ